MISFDYKDVTLIPRKCIVKSRNQCNPNVSLKNFNFAAPIYPANMKSVVNEETCIFLAYKGFFYTMHRFFNSNYIENQIRFCQKMKNRNLCISISVGVQGQDKKLIEELNKRNIIPDFITIDIAHGHSDRIVDIINKIRNLLPTVFIIAGNVCTTGAVKFLEENGAHGVKIGIGPGAVCTSYRKTGFGSRGYQLSCVKDCAEAAQNILVIADGGIKDIGDISKAICLGADLVMAGSLFAGYKQSAGRKIKINNEYYKKYYGSASWSNKNDKKHIEGTEKLVPYKGDMNLLLDDIYESLQSSISYAGGTRMEDLRKCHYTITR